MLQWPQSQTSPATPGACAGSGPPCAAPKRAISARRQRALLTLSGTVWRKQLQRIAAAPQVLRSPTTHVLTFHCSASLVLGFLRTNWTNRSECFLTAVLQQVPVGQPGSAAGAAEGGCSRATARQSQVPGAAVDAVCSRHSAAAKPDLHASRDGLRSAGQFTARTHSDKRPGTATCCGHRASHGGSQRSERSPARGAAPPASLAVSTAPGSGGAGQKRRRAQSTAGKLDTTCARTPPALRRTGRLGSALKHGGHVLGSERPWRSHVRRPRGKGAAERPRSLPLPPPLELAEQHAEVSCVF